MLLPVTFLAFVSLGLPDGLLGIAWPSIREAYGLSQASFGILLIGAGPGYLLSGIAAGRVLLRFGLARTLVGSTACAALGLALFALAPPWPWPIAALALVGLGSGTVDAGINAFASLRFSAAQVNWLHASYSLGAATGPALMTASLAAGWGWQFGYAGMSVLIGATTGVFAATARLLALPVPRTAEAAPAASGVLDALRHPLVPVQTALFFLYTGLEAALGAWSFTILTEDRHLSAPAAGTWVAAYFGSIFAGRVLVGAALARLGADRTLRFATLGALAGTLLVAAGPVPLACAGLVLSGFSLAPIFPTLVSRTADRMPVELALHAVGLKVSAAMIGAACLPIAAGLLVDPVGLRAVPALFVGAAVGVLALHERLLRLSARFAAVPDQADGRPRSAR